jgi:site-specific recombinase XerD
MQLPWPARRYATRDKGPATRKLVRMLHGWLRDEGLSLETVRPTDLDRFLARPVKPRTKNGYRMELRRYLDWLFAHGHIDFDAGWLRVRHQRVPPAGERFLAEIATTKRPATVRHYRHTIHRFYAWLSASGYSLEALTRAQMVGFFQHLCARGQSAHTRLNLLVALRVFLRDLDEQGALAEPADALIRAGDLPRLPTYLPRPLAPALDAALQKRLAASDSRFGLGLLLMRKTGLRVGELAALELDCIRRTPDGRTFLKVPLGKLQTERLVPIDDAVVAMIGALQELGEEARTWLLETDTGSQAHHVQFSHELARAAAGLAPAERITPHRLRHTYATELLCAGMSLVSVMKLLGHRDYRMTLRYAEITLEAVEEEYTAALTTLETRYRVTLSKRPQRAESFDPDRAVEDLMAWLRHHTAPDRKSQRKARTLIRRLERIQARIAKLDRNGPRDRNAGKLTR